MASIATPARREGLLRATRKVIESNHETFSKAGKRLGEIFSEEYLKQNDLNGLWLEKPSEELIYPRLECARKSVIYDHCSILNTEMRFEEPMNQEERKLAASMVVLTLVLAIDPKANKYVSESMCPFAALPWVHKDDGPEILGRSVIAWVPSEHNTVNSPPGEVLDLLEKATWSARTGDVMPVGLTVPTGDIREERRNAAWFSSATDGGLYPDLLRVAVTDGRLEKSIKVSNRWHHSIIEVYDRYPEYKTAIKRAKESEGAVSKPKN